MYKVAEQSMVLIFNSIYDVVEVSFDGQNFCPFEYLDLEHKVYTIYSCTHDTLVFLMQWARIWREYIHFLGLNSDKIN